MTECCTLRGVVLAGGTGSRLLPLTKVTNKHLLPVGEEPMIYYPIKRLTAAGITEIMIVTGVEHMGAVVNLLGSGRDFGAEFTYRVQDEAGGIAQALGLARCFCSDGRLAVILGDNIFEDEIIEFADAYRAQERGARVLLKEVPDPNRFGVAELDGKKIVSIEEKPSAPKSNYAVTGVYFFDSRVFEIIKTLKPSGRGELEISDVNNAYLRDGELEWDLINGWWTDAGTHESLYRANNLVRGLNE